MDRSNGPAEFFNNHPRGVNRGANIRAELQAMGGLPRNLRGDSPDFHSVKDRHLAANNNWPATENGRELPSTRMVAYQGRDIEFRYPDDWRVSEQGDTISIAPDNGFASGSLAYGMTIASFQPANDRFFGRNSFTVPGT